MSECVQADATYKLTWQGFPVLIVGVSDQNRTFHPIALAVCYGETREHFEFIFKAVKNACLKLSNFTWKPAALLADGSAAITLGFEGVFGTPQKRLMCNFHMRKNIEKRIKTLPAKEELLHDISCLQLCESDEIFMEASRLFLQKWEINTDTKDFINYFKINWLNDLKYWYEGASDFPSTNNGLEATNAVIKNQHTFRERLPVGQFLNLVEQNIVRTWSLERDLNSPNCKSFAVETTTTLKHWTEAYKWVKVLESNEGANQTFYALPTGSYLELSQQLVEKHNEQFMKWNDFEEFKDWRKAVRKIIFADNKVKCNCYNFLKEHICKHSIGIQVHTGALKVPPEAKTIKIGEKRKRGTLQKSTDHTVI